MKKLYVILILASLTGSVLAQDMGLSFSYFLPKNGYFSVPVTPFSIRGVGFDLTRFFAIESGFSLYRMSGMGVKDLPFESKKPLIGPFFSIMVPLEGVITFNFKNQAIKLKGGGFVFYNFDTKINEGNLDRELRSFLDWQVLNSQVSVSNHLGYGYRFGAEYILYFSKKFGISLEGYYLSGEAPLDMNGSYIGVPADGSPIMEEKINFEDAGLDFTGYEISIGVLFSP